MPGKILKDEETVESYKIEEKGFVVCMVNKVNAHRIRSWRQEHFSLALDKKLSANLAMQLQPKEPKPAPAASSSAVPATPAQPAVSTPAVPAAPAAQAASQAAAPATPTPARSAAPTTSETSAAFNDPSALTVGAERDVAIANMEAMGFERSQVEAAMRAAYFNPDRAVEYLLNVMNPLPYSV